MDGDEQQSCPCCKECATEFHKLVELKDSGLVLYCHRSRAENVGTSSLIKGKTVGGAVKQSGDVFILYNKKDLKITASELTSEFDKKSISCPRCRKILQHAQKLMKDLKSIDRKLVTAVCDHCCKKSQIIKKPFCACEEIAKKFISLKGELKKEAKTNISFPAKIGYLSKDASLNKQKEPRAPHKREKVHILCPSPSLADSETSLLETYHMEVKELPKSSLKDHKQDEIFEDMPEMDAKEVLKRRHDLSMRLMMRLGKDTGPPYSVSKRLDAYETPKTSLWEQNKFDVGSDIDIKKIPTPTITQSKQQDIDSRNTRDLDDPNRLVQFGRITTSVESFVETSKFDNYHRPKKFKEDEGKNKEKPLKLKRSLDEISHKPNKLAQQVKVSKSEPIEPVGSDLKPQYSFFFPKDKEKEKNQIKETVSSSVLIKDTQEMYALREKKKKEELQQKRERARKLKSEKDAQKERESAGSKKDSKLKLKQGKKGGVSGKSKKDDKDVTDDKDSDTGKKDEHDKKPIKEKERKEREEKGQRNKEIQEKDATFKDAKAAKYTRGSSFDKEKERDKKGELHKEIQEKDTTSEKASSVDTDKQERHKKGELDKEAKEKDKIAAKEAKERKLKEEKERKEMEALKKQMAKEREKEKLEKEMETDEASKKESQEKDAASKKESQKPKKKRDSSVDIKVSVSEIQKQANKEKNELSTIKLEKAKESKPKKNVHEPPPPKEKEKGMTAAELQKLRAELLKEKEEKAKEKQLREAQLKAAADDKARKGELKIKNIKFKKGSHVLDLIKIKQAKLKPSDVHPDDIKNHKCRHQHSGQYSPVCPLCLDSELELDVLNLERKKSVPKLKTDIIIGENIFNIRPRIEKIKEQEDVPLFFQKDLYVDSDIEPQTMKEVQTLKKTQPTQGQILEAVASKKDVGEVEFGTGVIRYSLSDRTFIEKGWTMLPTEKVVRKMNVYRMRPAHPEFDWFEHNKNKRLMTYNSGERLAEFDDNGRGRWYYRSGRLALEYYDAEETNAQQRFVVYSNGEPDERGRTHPITILATFDYLGNGIVFDHTGKIRLMYNQTEGVMLDRALGPVSHWQWHSLNDPPVLQQVMIDTQMAHKDPTILQLGTQSHTNPRPENEEMLAIEFDNFVREKTKKLSQEFKPFQIKMKAMKINEHFSLKVLDQATVYLIFRDGTTNIKLNIGMLLDHQEIVDTDTAEVGEVSNSMQRYPARTDSLAILQNIVANAQQFNKKRTDHERRLRPPEPCASADKLTAAASRPMRIPLKTVSKVSSESSCNTGQCSRKPTNNLYYNTRLLC